MIKTFIMIVVISNGYKAGITNIVAEFNDYELCVSTMNTIITDTNKTNDTRVISSQCVKKAP